MKTQGRTLDCPFNFLPLRFVAVWLFSVQTLWTGCPCPYGRVRAVIQAYGCGHPWRWKFAVRGRTCWDGLWRYDPGRGRVVNDSEESGTETRSGFGGHDSKFQQWSAPLNGAVLGVRRHSKATLLEHQRRKTPGISYDEVSPVRQETC